MQPFEIVLESGKIRHIYDNRYAERIEITNGKGLFGCVCYTRRDEDVNALPKRSFQPHAQHFAEVLPAEDRTFSNRGLGVFFEITQQGNALKLHWTYQNDDFSKFAAYLPLNFLSQKNGCWENQFLVSSPSYDPQSKRTLCLFTRPDGNHLMLIVSTPTEAFRIDYGTDSHFIDGFEIIENLDKSYGNSPKNSGEIIAYLVPVQSYEEGLAATAKLLNIPCAYYGVSSAPIGSEFLVEITGMCDSIVITAPDGKKTQYLGSCAIRLLAQQYGFYRIAPYREGKKGVECVCFAHYDWQKMHLNSIESVPSHKEDQLGALTDGTAVWLPPYAQYRGYVDSNLCEHTMWAWSQLRYMRHFPVSR